MRPRLDNAAQVCEIWSVEMSRRYSRRRYYAPKTPWEQLPAGKAALEERLKALREAKPEFEEFTKALLAMESAIKELCSKPESHQRPNLFSLEKDPLKRPLTQDVLNALTRVVREMAQRELDLLQRWPKAHEQSKQDGPSRFKISISSERAAIYKLESLHYDIQGDINKSEKELARVIKAIEAPARAKAWRDRKALEKARRDY